MERRKQILIRQGSNWEDVTEKYAIIYGAGQGCLDMMSELQLPNVRYVIDSDKKQWGKTIILLDQIYTIQPPTLLSELFLNEYYIAISSARYAEDIKKDIEFYANKQKVSICTNSKEFSFSYSSLEELLFYDSRIKSALTKTNWSQNLDRLIQLFVSITKEIFIGEKIERFISICNGGSKIVFCFYVNEEIYIFGIPALYCETEMALFSHNPKDREKRYLFRKEYGIGNELTVYENSAGVLIQHFGNISVNFDIENNKKVILEKCRELHQSGYHFEVQSEILYKRYKIATANLKRVAPYEYERIEKLDYESAPLFREIEKRCNRKKICHGDLNCANIVLWEGKLYLIDWEYMTMADPLYDVCSFLYSCKMWSACARGLPYKKISEELYTELGKNLSFYYKRICTKEEYYCACLVMQAVECKELVCDSFYMKNIEKERYDVVLNQLRYIKSF